MCRDDALHERRPGTGLPDDKDRGVALEPAGRRFEPLLGVEPLEGLVHADFGLLIEVQRAAPRRCTAIECVEGRFPVLEILEFLADAVPEECLCPRRVVSIFDELSHFVDVIVITRLAQHGKDPVRVRVAGRQRQRSAQGFLRALELANVHLAVRLVDEKRNVFRLRIHGPAVPSERLGFLAEHRMYVPDQVVNDRVVVSVAHRLVERFVGAQGLSRLHEQASQVRPGGAVLWLQRRDRAECRNSDAPLFELQRNQADEEVSFRNILASLQNLAAAGGSLVGIAGLEGLEPGAQGIAHPGLRRFS